MLVVVEGNSQHCVILIFTSDAGTHPTGEHADVLARAHLRIRCGVPCDGPFSEVAARPLFAWRSIKFKRHSA